MKKVICISNDNGRYERLELNKEYQCIDYYNDGDNNNYIVFNLGMKISYLDAEYGIYPKRLFKKIEEIREEKINILLNETY
jgi:hypothetical protein